MNRLLFCIACTLILASSQSEAQKLPDSQRAADVRVKIWPQLQKELKTMGFRDDQPIYIRIFKQPGILEVWVKNGRQYKQFKSYIICYFSGGLGTKTTNGDGKSPEGYYTIKPTQLNPVSNYHLAINVGYPNLLEQQRGYTGNAIMIHGNCASIGCYAMTDPIIDEIYTLAYEAFLHGQKAINLDILPFKLNEDNLKSYPQSPYLTFWRQLKPGYDLFERTHVPPEVSVINKTYVFRQPVLFASE